MQTRLLSLSHSLGELLSQRNLRLATAESCTGGQLAQVITAIPGSSQWFDRGFVSYSNIAKQEMLGVSLTTLNNFGAVSIQTAQEMAKGALTHSHADLSLAVTGIAGPGSASLEKPVGTVCFAWTGINFTTHTQEQLFQGDRLNIRDQAAEFALQTLIKFVKEKKLSVK